MKPLHLILVVLLAGGAGAAGGYFASRCSSCSTATNPEALQADIKPAGLPVKSTTREAELAAKVENLERALDAMHQDLTELRAGNSRTSAVEPEKAPVDQDSMAFAAQHKTAIKAIIEEERAEQARKLDEERKQRAIEQAQQQADRVAQKLGMNPAQTKQLEGYVENMRLRGDELRATMQNPTGDQQSMRQAFQDFRTQAETELTNLFGADLAGKIKEEGLGMGMGRGGPGAWGGGQGGDPTGGNNGGGGRRGRNGGGQGTGGGGAGSGQPGGSGPGGG